MALRIAVTALSHFVCSACPGAVAHDLRESSKLMSATSKNRQRKGRRGDIRMFSARIHPKKSLDVLLWGSNWARQNWEDLDAIQVLRDYLRTIRPSVCDIRLFVPATQAETIERLGRLNIGFVAVEIINAEAETSKCVSDSELADATQTALACDADALVVSNIEWFPYCVDLENLGLFLTDTGFLKYYCEIFVRGHEVP
jgi:hypothetical protein